MAWNMFENCNTIDELDDNYDIRVSPENLSCDGELTQEEIDSSLARINEHFEIRETQILFGRK